MKNNKVILQITPWAQITNKQKKVKTNILTKTPVIFLNLENRKILIVLHTKNPKS